MFGNRETIDESSYRMIDESDTDIVDDIKDEKRYGSHAGHLCDEGDFHERYDKWSGGAYNRTPQSNVYPSPTAQQTMQYPQPTQQMSAPAQPERQMQRTVVNGRTYERPADPNAKPTASPKATALFMVLLMVGLLSLCSGSPLTLIVSIFMGVMILKTSAKGPSTETDKKVNALTAVAIVVIIFSGVLSCAGISALKTIAELFKEIEVA